MIVLVDTSVWIRFLSNRDPYATDLDALLSREEVSGHDFVSGELLIEDKGGRKQLLRANAPGAGRASSRCRRIVRDRRLHGRGIGWIDAHLLASALVGRLRVWTLPPPRIALRRTSRRYGRNKSAGRLAIARAELTRTQRG